MKGDERTEDLDRWIGHSGMTRGAIGTGSPGFRRKLGCSMA
jgi:hypothetical protein